MLDLFYISGIYVIKFVLSILKRCLRKISYYGKGNVGCINVIFVC